MSNQQINDNTLNIQIHTHISKDRYMIVGHWFPPQEVLDGTNCSKMYNKSLRIQPHNTEERKILSTKIFLNTHVHILSTSL